MSGLVDAAHLIRDELRAAGVRADLDPRNINPPAVWIQLREVENLLAAGARMVTFRLFLIVGDAGTEQALAALDQLLDATATAGWDWSAEPIETVTVSLPGVESTQLPALRLPSVRVKITP